MLNKKYILFTYFLFFALKGWSQNPASQSPPTGDTTATATSNATAPATTTATAPAKPNPSAPAPQTTVPTSNNYNLEGVVIEGRKSKVDTLIDLNDFNVELEEVILNRNHFDDFVEIDTQLRPQFAK